MKSHSNFICYVEIVNTLIYFDKLRITPNYSFHTASFFIA
jgi:hypothetical protein